MSRFHEKYHRSNHHTNPSGLNPDAGHDPIASPSYPFQGMFVLNGPLSAFTPTTSAYSAALLGAKVGINTTSPTKQLTVNGDTELNGDLYLNGSLHVNNVTTNHNNVNQINSDTLYLSSAGVKPALTLEQFNIIPNQYSIMEAYYHDFINTRRIAFYIDGKYSTPGFIGIGTSTPNRTLTVVGDVSSNQTLYSNSLIVGTGASISNADVTVLSNNPNGGLFVTQSSDQGFALKVSDQAGNDPSPFVIDNAGNVGIGTTNLGQNKLTVIGDLSAVGKIKNIGDIYSSGGSVYAQGLAIGTGASSSNPDGIIVSNNPNGGLLVAQNNTSGFAFKVTDSGLSDNSPFIIDNYGNVGIGTADTSKGALTVVGDIKTTGKITNTGDIYSQSGRIYAQGLALGTGASPSNADAVIVSNSPNGGLFVSQNNTSGFALKVSDNAGDDPSPFIIDNTGNVAIGTKNTSRNKLTVVGDLSAVGKIYNTGDIHSANGSIYAQALNIGAAASNSNPDAIIASNNPNGGLFISQINTNGYALKISDQGGTDPSPFIIDNAGNVIVGGTTSKTNGITVYGSVVANSFTGDGDGLVINKETRFKSFKKDPNFCGTSTFYRTNTFQSLDNRLYIAGYSNGYGLGLGPNANYSDGFKQTMIPLGVNEYITNWYSSAFSLFALSNTGNLYATGSNNWGQLGQGDTNDRNYWVKIQGISNVTYFSCHNGAVANPHCLAIVGGKLYAWGYNGYGQLGIGVANGTAVKTPQLVNQGDIANVTLTKTFACGDDYASYSYSFVVDSNKQIYVAGYNNGQLGMGNGAPTNVLTFSKLQTTSNPNYNHADVIKSKLWNGVGTTHVIINGILYACGSNNYGQLGVGSIDNDVHNTLNTFSSLQNVKDIQTFDYHNASVIVLLNDGTIRTWGYNGQGQLGNGTTSSISSPYNPNLTNIIKIAGIDINYGMAYALDSNGNLWASGYNNYGQLGNGNDNQNKYFAPVYKDANIKFVDFDVWGYNSGTGFTAADSNGFLWSCGYNGQYSTGVSYGSNSLSWISIINKVHIH